MASEDECVHESRPNRDRSLTTWFGAGSNVGDALTNPDLLMRTNVKRVLKSILILFSIATLTGARIAQAGSVDTDAPAALSALYEKSPAARALGEKAKGILVFPQIDKAALLVGGQTGQGAMFANGEIVGHYRADGVLFGLEAGGQSYAYAMFFMSDKALENLKKTRGFEIGADPNIVVIDAGAAKEVSTITTQPDVYGYVFNQSGLMGGIALNGMKIAEVRK